MKNITINNNVWKELKKIKKKHNFKQMGQAVEYLQNHQLSSEATMNHQVSVKNSGFLEENPDLAEIRMHVDALKVKSLGETTSEKQHSIAKVEILCLQCDNIPFALTVSDYGDMIQCPFCGYSHNIAIFLGDMEVA